VFKNWSIFYRQFLPTSFLLLANIFLVVGCANSNLGGKESVADDSELLSAVSEAPSQFTACDGGSDTSRLWGQAGEKWKPKGRLVDYSYAGYHSGEAPLPNLPIIADIKIDYGASGNGITDDTQSFKNFINDFKNGTLPSNQPSNGALLVPARTYKISDILYFEMNNFELRGAGKNATIFKFTKSVTQAWGANSWAKHGKGAMLWFGLSKKPSSTTGLGNYAANVVVAAKRLDTILKLSNIPNSGAGKISAGDTVVLKMVDPGDLSLGLHGHNGKASPGSCTYSLMEYHNAFTVKSVNYATDEIVIDQPLKLDARLAWNPKIYTFAGRSLCGP
jgi:hypothetical protein